MPVFIILFGALFVVFLATALSSLLKGLRARHYEGRTLGVVIQIQHYGSRREKSRNHNYLPVFFYTVDGVEYKNTFDVLSSDPKRFQEGDEVILAYDPKDPNKFAPEGDTSMMTSSILFFVGAALCAFLFCLTVF